MTTSAPSARPSASAALRSAGPTMSALTTARAARAATSSRSVASAVPSGTRPYHRSGVAKTSASVQTSAARGATPSPTRSPKKTQATSATKSAAVAASAAWAMRAVGSMHARGERERLRRHERERGAEAGGRAAPSFVHDGAGQRHAVAERRDVERAGGDERARGRRQRACDAGERRRRREDREDGEDEHEQRQAHAPRASRSRRHHERLGGHGERVCRLHAQLPASPARRRRHAGAHFSVAPCGALAGRVGGERAPPRRHEPQRIAAFADGPKPPPRTVMSSPAFAVIGATAMRRRRQRMGRAHRRCRRRRWPRIRPRWCRARPAARAASPRRAARRRRRAPPLARCHCSFTGGFSPVGGAAQRPLRRTRAIDRHGPRRAPRASACKRRAAQQAATRMRRSADRSMCNGARDSGGRGRATGTAALAAALAGAGLRRRRSLPLCIARYFSFSVFGMSLCSAAQNIPKRGAATFRHPG